LQRRNGGRPDAEPPMSVTRISQPNTRCRSRAAHRTRSASSPPAWRP
jgi:hypothetical protein